MKNKHQSGFITLIFILVIALIGTLVLVVGQSRLFVALQRGKSSADTLIAGYQAESEINDLLYRIRKGYLSDKVFDYTSGATPNTVQVRSRMEGRTQIINVVASRSFATNQIRATINTTVTSTTLSEPTHIVLMLDCTGSMDSLDSRTTSRFQEQTRAARQFVRDISRAEFADNIKLGIGVFGTTAKWLQTDNGTAVRPNSGLSYDQMIETLNQQFGVTRADSPACFLSTGDHLGYTNIGAGFLFAHNHMANVAPKYRKVEVLITDGQPNARLADPNCPPDPGRTVEEDINAGLVYAKCMIADTQTKWDGTHFGRRSTDIEAYGVTVLSGSDRSAAVIDAFQRFLGADHYFSPQDADELTNIVQEISTDIISSQGVTVIQRVIPEQ